MEELLLQLYYGHFSLAEVESLLARLWGESDGAGRLRELVPDLIERINRWLTQPAQNFYPYIFLHAVEYRGRRSAEEPVKRIAAAVGIDPQGYREALGVVAGPASSAGSWAALLAALAARGVRAPRLVVGETTDGAMRAAVKSRWRGCGFLMPLSELEGGLLGSMDPLDVPWVHQGVAELRDYANTAASRRIGLNLQARLQKAGYAALGAELRERLHRHRACYDVPRAHLPRLRGANIIRTELGRVRDEARVLGPIADERALVLLAAANFRRQGRTSWNAKPFLSF